MLNRIAPHLLTRRIVIGIAIATAVILTVLLPEQAPENQDKPNNETPAEPTVNTAEPGQTIASSWQWENFSPSSTRENTGLEIADTGVTGQIDEQASMNDAPFTEESVYAALQSIRLDDNQDIILDNEALAALDESLDFHGQELSSEQLIALQDIIRTGLPGKTGEQAAQIVADYYQYLGASKEFNDIYESSMDSENFEARYEELASLRSLYLGQDVAEQLFRVSDANARYMFDMMLIDNDAEASEEDKQLMRDQVSETHLQQTIDIPDWSNRYQAFAAQKQTIIASGITDAEKRRQLSQLLRQHFSSTEVAKIQHLQLDSP